MDMHTLGKVGEKGGLGGDHRERRDNGSMAGITPNRWWRVVIDGVEGVGIDKKEIGDLNRDMYTDTGRRRPVAM